MRRKERRREDGKEGEQLENRVKDCKEQENDPEKVTKKNKQVIMLGERKNALWQRMVVREYG